MLRWILIFKILLFMKGQYKARHGNETHDIVDLAMNTLTGGS